MRQQDQSEDKVFYEIKDKNTDIALLIDQSDLPRKIDIFNQIFSSFEFVINDQVLFKFAEMLAQHYHELSVIFVIEVCERFHNQNKNFFTTEMNHDIDVNQHIYLLILECAIDLENQKQEYDTDAKFRRELLINHLPNVFDTLDIDFKVLLFAIIDRWRHLGYDYQFEDLKLSIFLSFYTDHEHDDWFITSDRLERVENLLLNMNKEIYISDEMVFI